MLIEFRVKNYKSFKDECVFSMVAGKDNSLPDNTFQAGKHTLLKAAAVYGANASGKSNLLKAIEFMREFVLESADPTKSRPLGKIDTIPFLLDNHSDEEPSEFAIVFIHGEKQYEYGFSVDTKRIHEEWLFVTEPSDPKKPNPRPQTWFTRSWDNEAQKYDWKFGSLLRGAKVRLREETLENSLFLSKAAYSNHPQLLKVYEWFNTFLRTHKQKDLGPHRTAKILHDKQYAFIRNMIVDLIKKADLGISGLSAKEKKFSPNEIKFPDEIPTKERERFLKHMEEHPQYDIKFEHKGSEGSATFPLEWESEGTQRLFALLGPLLDTVANGFTVCLDELESSLHPELVHFVIEFVHKWYPENKAQLIFTTHDTTLLDNELFRRDQIWFTQKLKNGSTDLYSLLDHKARKGEAWQKGYLSGRYGAVPIIERFES